MQPAQVLHHCYRPTFFIIVCLFFLAGVLFLALGLLTTEIELSDESLLGLPLVLAFRSAHYKQSCDAHSQEFDWDNNKSGAFSDDNYEELNKNATDKIELSGLFPEKQPHFGDRCVHTLWGLVLTMQLMYSIITAPSDPFKDDDDFNAKEDKDKIEPFRENFLTDLTGKYSISYLIEIFLGLRDDACEEANTCYCCCGSSSCFWCAGESSLNDQDSSSDSTDPGSERAESVSQVDASQDTNDGVEEGRRCWCLPGEPSLTRRERKVVVEALKYAKKKMNQPAKILGVEICKNYTVDFAVKLYLLHLAFVFCQIFRDGLRDGKFFWSLANKCGFWTATDVTMKPMFLVHWSAQWMRLTFSAFAMHQLFRETSWVLQHLVILVARNAVVMYSLICPPMGAYIFMLGVLFQLSRSVAAWCCQERRWCEQIFIFFVNGVLTFGGPNLVTRIPFVDKAGEGKSKVVLCNFKRVCLYDLSFVKNHAWLSAFRALGSSTGFVLAALLLVTCCFPDILPCKWKQLQRMTLRASITVRILMSHVLCEEYHLYGWHHRWFLKWQGMHPGEMNNELGPGNVMKSLGSEWWTATQEEYDKNKRWFEGKVVYKTLWLKDMHEGLQRVHRQLKRPKGNNDGRAAMLCPKAGSDWSSLMDPCYCQAGTWRWKWEFCSTVDGACFKPCKLIPVDSSDSSRTREFGTREFGARFRCQVCRGNYGDNGYICEEHRYYICESCHTEADGTTSTRVFERWKAINGRPEEASSATRASNASSCSR